MRAALALLFVAVLANWPIWSVETWLGTEQRRVEIAREMADTGDLVVPTLGLEPTLAKPPFYYWVLAGIDRVFGVDPIWMRAPSILALWLLSWLAFCVLRRSHETAVGWVGALGVLCSPTIIYHASFAEIDPMFAAFTAASILMLGHGVGLQGTWPFVAAGVLGALALLTKGPPYFLFLVGPLLVWWRRAPMLRGLAIFLPVLLVAPVVYFFMLRAHPASAELQAVAGEETVGRLFTYEWKHIVDLPMHFLRAALVMMPFALWTFAEHRGTHEARVAQGDLQQRFCTASALASIFVFALFPGRPVRYLLPAVLLFVIGVAPALVGYVRYAAPVAPTPLRIVRGLGVLGGVALCVLPFLPFPLPGGSVWFALGLGVAPLLVKTRVHVVVYALAVPVLASWTVLADRARYYERGVRSSVDVGGLVLEEMEKRGVEDVATYGHFNYAFVFGHDAILPGDERWRRAPTTEWLLVEHRGDVEPRPAGYVDRVRIRSRHRDIVLLQRER